MILKNLWRRKTRTFLTVLGIAISVAAVVALSAFGEGMASGFERIFSSADADLMVTQADAIIALISSVDESVGDELRQMSGVEEVCGSVVGMITMPEIPYFFVMGEDPRGFKMAHYNLIEGEPLRAKRQILLGKLTAKNFKKGVGDTFRINELNFRVAGIYETGAAIEDGGAVVALADAQGAFDKRNQVNFFSIRLKDVRRIDEVKAAIEERFPDLAAGRSGENTRQSEALDLYRSFGWFLGIFGVLVGGLGMMNTTLMSVIERTREIGVLRALGWRRRRIIGLIFGESLALALAGGVLGIALGYGLIELARLAPATESLLAGTITTNMLVQALVTALLLGTVGGLYPAWRAAQLQPIEAMRRESGVGGNLGPVTRFFARRMGGALRNLWRRPSRTLVTVLGIGIGVAFIVVGVGITGGFAVLFAQMGGAGQADLMAEEAGVSDASLSTIDERIADRIAGRPDVRGISKIIMGVSTAPGTAYLMVFGIDPSETYIRHYKVREGRLIERPREIMIGRFLARSMKRELGEKLTIGGSTFEIVGIFENGIAFEDAGGAITLEEAQRVFNKPRQVSFLGITLNDPARADAVALEIEAEHPEIIVSRPVALVERMNDMQVTYAVLNALIGLTVLVGGIVMMNSMLMSVFERTQEIGVLRAVGWSRWRVVRMVLAESLALSFLSALLGIAMGVELAYAFTLEPTMGSMLAPSFKAESFAQLLALALLLGAIGGIYPAWRAANLRPIEALRYE